MFDVKLVASSDLTVNKKAEGAHQTSLSCILTIMV